jgi:serine/threonine-protein kinase HipA
MAGELRRVEVLADWRSGQPPLLVGLLTASEVRGREVFAFEYAASFLTAPDAFALDPALPLVRGPLFVPRGHDNFGLFLDASPDRWGRVLLQRREAQRAREVGRKERRLGELDYLLGVFDEHRMGALRLRIDGGPFLDDDRTLASPPWTSLRELEAASKALEKDGAEKSPSYAKWLRLLVAPGRSLGGARPKASVVDEAGALWIAKFPSGRDAHDVGAWEAVAHRLARAAGIEVPETRCERFGSRHHTFLARRFDRAESGARRHFSSAMTLLQRRDGEEGASYLDLAALLVQGASDPPGALEQLWRRMVFSVCISNVDDHLRNHGFLLQLGRRRGWTLSPAYDLNPVATGNGLTLNISETDNAQEPSLLLEVAPHFRVKAARAEQILAEMRKAIRRWHKEAAALGISRSEQERMAPAFRVGEAE